MLRWFQTKIFSSGFHAGTFIILFAFNISRSSLRDCQMPNELFEATKIGMALFVALKKWNKGL